MRSALILPLASFMLAHFLLPSICTGQGVEKLPGEVPSGPKRSAGRGAPGGEREVPEPLIPDLENVPSGLAPSAWDTWAQGQDIDGLPRISIRLLALGSQPMPFSAGNGMDAPKWDDITEFSPG
ncbi:MAG: hypothetical protein ACYTFG_13840, partial [Planctomycetota bacterium]